MKGSPERAKLVKSRLISGDRSQPSCTLEKALSILTARPWALTPLNPPITLQNRFPETRFADKRRAQRRWMVSHPLQPPCDGASSLQLTTRGPRFTLGGGFLSCGRMEAYFIFHPDADSSLAGEGPFPLWAGGQAEFWGRQAATTWISFENPEGSVPLPKPFPPAPLMVLIYHSSFRSKAKP